MDTPQIDDLLILGAEVAAAIIAISGAVAILHRVLFKKINDKIDTIDKELRPNHGTSMRDAINRIEENQSEMKTDLKDVREKVDDHIQWHLDHQ